jgi:hypothetical protein
MKGFFVEIGTTFRTIGCSDDDTKMTERGKLVTIRSITIIDISPFFFVRLHNFLPFTSFCQLNISVVRIALRENF